MSTTRETTQEANTPDDVCLRVVAAVAELLETDPMDLEPINADVDTDALAALFADGSGPRVEFPTNGCRVVVQEDGDVLARRLVDD